MRKTTLTIVGGAAGVAAALLFFAATKSSGYSQPHPFGAASWLSAVLAFLVFIVAQVEYAIYGRDTHLYLGASFLSLGIIGIWDSILLPAAVKSTTSDVLFFALWQAEWITLAVTMAGILVMNRGLSTKRSQTFITSVIAGGVVWAAAAIFVLAVFPQSATAIAHTALISWICAGVLLVEGFIYSRPFVHRNNLVISTLAYGLGAAALAEALVAVSPKLFGFAHLMKVLVFLLPLAGMMAEHSRLQKRLEMQAGDLANLMQTQQAITSAKSVPEMFRRIVEIVSFAFSGVAVCIFAFDNERGLLYSVAHSSIDDEIAKRLFFRSGEGPVGECFYDKETVFVRDAAVDPVLSQKFDGINGVGSAAFAPLVVRDECLGVLGVFFLGDPLRAQKLSKDHSRLLAGFASQTAVAVESAHMKGRVIDNARVTDDYSREMDLVWEIGRAVAGKLELHALVDTLAEKLKDATGSSNCSVLIFDKDTVGLKIMGTKSLTRHNSVEDHIDRCDQISAMVAKTGEPAFIQNVPNSCRCKYPSLAAEDGGTHHLLSVPMSLRGFVGAITVIRQNTEPFSEREKRLLTKLAPVVAAGIRNADMYEREKKIAESLQQSFLPKLPHDLPGAEVESIYQAAFDESSVGGDFYDIVDLGDNRYGIAVGDVAGKGLDAAVYTAMTRYMVQAYSVGDQDPVSVVTRLNGALYRYTPVHKFVTLVYGVLDLTAGRFTYVNAGHELPFRYSGGELTTLPGTGPAAGAVEDAEYSRGVVEFKPDDILVFYTDGASDARSDGKFLGTEGLAGIVGDCIRADADNLPAAILKGVVDYSDGKLRDDVAVVSIKGKEPGRLF